MEKYRFIIEVSANSEAEAQVRLNLLLELGAFLKDFNTNRLPSSIFNYLLLYLAEKCSDQANETSTNKQR